MNGDIPSTKVYEDEHVFAFLDINPISSGHTLVVPKNHSVDFFEMGKKDVCEMMETAKKVGAALLKMGADGINVGMNNKTPAGQEVMHSHLHVIPRYVGDGLEHWHGREASLNDLKSVSEKIISFL
ncbi:HIT family protein [Candidatus Woesearchaeota archaeon]|nr:HIT family protein [Candidatus Woesearchaeota archaeon]